MHTSIKIYLDNLIQILDREGDVFRRVAMSDQMISHFFIVRLVGGFEHKDDLEEGVLYLGRSKHVELLSPHLH